MNKTLSVIIVTHNSARYLDPCMESLANQTIPPNQIILVDSGSQNTDYIEKYENKDRVHLCLANENIGFCKGNNLGYSLSKKDTDYVLFLNPDAFLTPTFIEQALNFMEDPKHQNVGALSGILLGYDIDKKTPTKTIDSSGILHTWYGRWYDRGQGELYQPSQYTQVESVPALCGALLFCRKIALETVVVKPNQVLDPTFFMYKEDIDLSLRLRKRGWDLKINPSLIAYHCRGWQKNRKQVPKNSRLLSAKNEIRLHVRERSPCLLYSALKYLFVKVLNV